MTETWTYNGSALNVFGKWGIESVLEGIGIPDMRGGNTQIPFAHGTRWVKKRFDRRKVVLAMWIRGRDRTELDQNIDDFLRTFGRPGTHSLQRTLSSGTVREAQAELSSAIQMVRKAPNHVKFALELELADPFFYDTMETEETKTVTSSPLEWTHENPGTAVTVGLEIVLSGPLQNPLLRNRSNDVWLQYLAPIAADETVVIDTKAFTCVVGEENRMTALRHGGDAYWQVLQAGQNLLRLESDAAGGTVTLRYRPAYY